MTDWANIRARFPIVERSIYLNTGWAGPSPREAVVAMQQRVEREAYEGPQSLEVRYEKAQIIESVRHGVASLIGADDDELALIYTTTEGMNTVLRGLGLGAGDHIITCNLEHNAIMVPSYLARERDGAELSIVRFRSDEDSAQMLDMIEAAMNPESRVVQSGHEASDGADLRNGARSRRARMRRRRTIGRAYRFRCARHEL
jgi:selenocysteine lyase/cysteine desulfurase